MPSVPKPPTTRAASPRGLSGIRRSRRAFVLPGIHLPFVLLAGLLTPRPALGETPPSSSLPAGVRSRSAGPETRGLRRGARAPLPGLLELRTRETKQERRDFGAVCEALTSEEPPPGYATTSWDPPAASDLQSCRERGDSEKGRGRGGIVAERGETRLRSFLEKPESQGCTGQELKSAFPTTHPTEGTQCQGKERDRGRAFPTSSTLGGKDALKSLGPTVEPSPPSSGDHPMGAKAALEGQV